MSIFGELDFNEWISEFQDVGGYDVVLPFLLIFAVIFAILQKIKLFGDEDKTKKINGIISLIMALFLVAQTGMVEILQQFLPRISMVVVVLLMLLLVVGVFTKSTAWASPALGLGVIIAIVAVLWAIGAAAGWNVPLIEDMTDHDIAVLLMLGVFILVVWLIVKEPGESGGIGSSFEKFINSFKGP